MNNTGKQVILIFNGDQAQTRILHFYLEDAGYRVFDACAGENAALLLNLVKPQLVILDWHLPDVNALAITRMIRASEYFARMPVIMLGREIGWENRVLALEAGVDLCMEGAISPKELVARVRAMLRRVSSVNISE